MVIDAPVEVGLAPISAERASPVSEVHPQAEPGQLKADQAARIELDFPQPFRKVEPVAHLAWQHHETWMACAVKSVVCCDNRIGSVQN